ncbi:STAS domain-containing protein [Stieleria varia]|uniref:STAS domain protein n=1 Tax=Stieleria varia TaxID=2528005 RepID=A0A5C6A299_9BACT|nr:STAS domain-containing protein [Stieleria varia]TWT93982.1 STAS domain protein [Stieleria varia]
MPLIERHGTITVLRPSGPVRCDTVSPLNEMVSSHLGGGVPLMVIDFSAAPLIDGAGLEWLLCLSENISRRGGCMRICGVNELCSDLLRITGVGDRIETLPDLTSALGSFA